MKYGEYVRFEDGKIKIVTYQLKEFIDEHISKSENNRVEFLGKIKHSKNIIDLIQVGDFVNGYRILAMEDSIYENSKRILIYKNQKERYERWIYIQECDGKIYTQDDLVEILTKEMYEQNVFKVVE